VLHSFQLRCLCLQPEGRVCFVTAAWSWRLQLRCALGIVFKAFRRHFFLPKCCLRNFYLLQAHRQRRKLNFLITQTELYAHFMNGKLKAEKLKGMIWKMLRDHLVVQFYLTFCKGINSSWLHFFERRSGRRGEKDSTSTGPRQRTKYCLKNARWNGRLEGCVYLVWLEFLRRFNVFFFQRLPALQTCSIKAPGFRAINNCWELSLAKGSHLVNLMLKSTTNSYCMRCSGFI